MKVCHRHEQAFEVGKVCPWCDEPSEQALLTYETIDVMSLIDNAHVPMNTDDEDAFLKAVDDGWFS